MKQWQKQKKNIGDRPFFAGVIGPFSLAARLMDVTEIMVKCMTEPGFVKKVLQIAADFIGNYCALIKKTGVDGIIIAEPAAGLLSPAMCEEFSSCYIKKIVDELQSDTFIFTYHNCGNTIPLINSILSIGAKAYHFGNAVDIGDVLKKMPADVLVMGNLSPAKYFLQGTPELISKATGEMLQKAKEYCNYVPSSGCDIPPQAPIENIKAFFETTDRFNRLKDKR